MKPTYTTNTDGNKYWWLGDDLHREDGPAIEYNDGGKQWCLNGKLHREDGPACEWSNGFKEWFYQGKQIDCKDNREFLRMIKLMIFL